MKVEVYFNLHKSCYSIRCNEDGVLKGIVVAHAKAVELKDVTARVSPAGRDRVRREGKKNVHAFIRGTLVGTTMATFAEAASGYATSKDTIGYNTRRSALEALEAAERIGVMPVYHQPPGRIDRVNYNPYTCDTFQTLEGAPFEKCDAMVLQSDRKLFAMYRKPKPQPRYTCWVCKGVNVELLKPAWVNPNIDGTTPELDAEAEPLSTWCHDCEDHMALWDNVESKAILGRW
jgi:hypothetical protein